MKLYEILEDDDSKKPKSPIDEITYLLFKKPAEVIKDPKRDRDKSFLGIMHDKSTIVGPNGKHLKLTFDNSTDSNEFELDSLTPLKIIKDGEIDRHIKRLFSKFEIETKKTTTYSVKPDGIFLREIHFGTKLGRPAVKLMIDIVKILKSLNDNEEETSEEDDTEDDKDTKEKSKNDKDDDNKVTKTDKKTSEKEVTKKDTSSKKDQTKKESPAKKPDVKMDAATSKNEPTIDSKNSDSSSIEKP